MIDCLIGGLNFSVDSFFHVLCSIFQQQIDCILAVVQSPLFRMAECRKVLLPFFCQYLAELDDAKRQCPGASKVLMEMVVVLSDETIGPTRFHDLAVLIEKLLRGVVNSVIHSAGKTSEVNILQ